MITLRPLACWHGPNPVSVEPVLVFDLRLAAGARPEDWAALAAAWPALAESNADWTVDEPVAAAGDGDDSALTVGALLASWALQALNFCRGLLHAAGAGRTPGHGALRLWVGFHHPAVTQEAVQLAAAWLAAAARGEAADPALRARRDALWRACRLHHPDYQARLVMQAARVRDVPWAPAWGLPRHWRFGQGGASRVVMESSLQADGHLAARASRSKLHTKQLLRALGLPTPAWRVVSDAAQLAQAVDAVGFPCVTKPLDGHGGQGVSAGLTTRDAVQQGFEVARQHTAGPILVEAFVPGDDHRLMVVRGQLVAVIRREPPSVVGDGRSTVRELVVQANAGRDPRSLVRSGYRRRIELDASAQLQLQAQGLTPDAVPQAGLRVRVRSNANLSTGGVCTDVTAHIHPGWRVLAESLAHTLGLAMVGMDLLTVDIRHPPGAAAAGPAGLVEINTHPGLDALVAAGWTEQAVGALVLDPAMGRIPVHLRVVPQALLESVLDEAEALAWPPGWGWASARRAGLAGQAEQASVALAIGDGPVWPGVQVLLGHRAVTAAVVVAGDADLCRHGLPVDRADTVQRLGAELAPGWVAALRRVALNPLPDASWQGLAHALAPWVPMTAKDGVRLRDGGACEVSGQGICAAGQRSDTLDSW